MKTKTLVRVSGMILLAVAVSLVVMAMLYAMQNASSLTISWNG
jgi:hypothetical protein